jgi:hypothetical protein
VAPFDKRRTYESKGENKCTRSECESEGNMDKRMDKIGGIAVDMD